MKRIVFLILLCGFLGSCLNLPSSRCAAQTADTLPVIRPGEAVDGFDRMWAGFDPRAEPLEVEVLKEWEEEGVVLRVVRFRIGVFKGERAMLAAIYGYPTAAALKNERVPGLVQIHGGGQYADYRACLTNGKRGYATVSLAWAGRISAPGYRVSPSEVALFWDGKTNDPAYRVTTDWGAVDGYHAPARNEGSQFPSAAAKPWTLDAVESPRNSGWFLGAVAARRALTFLERQGEVDPDRLGVYGHSMGGKLTVLSAVDPRVKAAAPSCGGISDRDNKSLIFRQTLGDHVSLARIRCPIMFLSPANDFHGRIGDIPAATSEIQSPEWRVTCSPHHNHQDTPEFEVATQLWFDQHLKGGPDLLQTPVTVVSLETPNGFPRVQVRADRSRRVLGVDVYYTQEGLAHERPEHRENTMSRFWHHAAATAVDGDWMANLTMIEAGKPLWIYANVTYPLASPITGAGYYYGPYTANRFVLSSVLEQVSAEACQDAKVRTIAGESLLIEDFAEGWNKEWFSYRPDEWGRSTHKLYDGRWQAPDLARLSIDVRSLEANVLVVRIDDYFAKVALSGGRDWQSVRLSDQDFRDYAGMIRSGWEGVRRLTLSARERIRPPRGVSGAPLEVGAEWRGTPPQFRNLRWVPASD